MSCYKDKGLEERIKKLNEEMKEKRDRSPKGSEAKKYYRKASKCLEQTFKRINERN